MTIGAINCCNITNEAKLLVKSQILGKCQIV